MKDIKKPEFMAEIPSGGHAPLLEILIALGIFFAGSILCSFVQMPALMVYLFGNREYQEMIFAGRVSIGKMMELVSNVPQWMNIFLLVGEIGLIAIVLIYCRFMEKRKIATLGFRKKGCVLNYLKGILLGLFLFGVVYLLCYVSGSLSIGTPDVSGDTLLYVAGFFLGYLIQGMAEEVLCRGYLLVSLSRRCSVVLSVILSSLFFSMLHGMNPGVTLLAYINLFLFGVFMALLFLRCENIWIVAAVHSIWNFAQGNLLGVQVSGMKLQPSMMSSDMKKGWEIIHGGAFGIEGGLAVTLVLAVAVWLLLLSMKKRGMFIESEGTDNLSVMGEVKEEQYQNMGVRPEETPWRPENKKENDESAAKFDHSYFKD